MICVLHLQYVCYSYVIPANFFPTQAWDFCLPGIRSIMICEDDPIFSENVKRYPKTLRRFSKAFHIFPCSGPNPGCVSRKNPSQCHATKHALRDRVWRTLRRASVTARNWILLLFFCQPAQQNDETILFCCGYCFQDCVNMYCDLCKTRKLRREFPLDTMTEKCDHAPLHCLRVST